MSEYELEVHGMTCGSCEAIVQRRVSDLEGVESVEADSDANAVAVVGDEDARDAVADRIEATGYDVLD